MSEKEKTKKSLNVVVMHLDLGIGGAEQLIVTIARLLQEKGHRVALLTTHHDASHCFEETKPDGCLGPLVRVHGDWLPRKLLGRCTALFAILRMLFLALVVGVFYRNTCDVVIIDGVSAPVPVLRWFGLRVLFYCHFPDLLLCTDRQGAAKRLYRRFIDGFEELTTGRANCILVNSQFTAGIFNETFPSIAEKHKPQVLYPAIRDLSEDTAFDKATVAYCSGFEYVFCSLNRFERKKKVEVAISAMHTLKAELLANGQSDRSAVLVVAGGYDLAVEENVQYLEELKRYCDTLGLQWVYLPPHDSPLPAQRADVIFRTSISSAERTALFHVSRALLYTPDREHFGIVPLEAMQLGLPVIAVNSGGPKETISHEETGFLCKQDGEDFGRCMWLLASDQTFYEKMREAAPKRVTKYFSERAMKESIHRFVLETSSQLG